MATPKPNPQQVAQAAAALKAKNAAIQAPVNTTPAPNLKKLATIAPSVAGQLAKPAMPQPQPAPLPKQQMPQPAPLPSPVLAPPSPPGYLQNPDYQKYGAQQNAIQQQLQAYMQQSPAYKQMMDTQNKMSALQGNYGPVAGLGQMSMIQQSPELQKYQQQQLDLNHQLDAYAHNAPMFQQMMELQGKMKGIQDQYGSPNPQLQNYMATEAGSPSLAQFQGQPQGARPAPKTNPTTGLGAFSANPSIAAANPFAGLGITAGAQQAQQNIPPPYNPSADTFQSTQQPPASLSQGMGQLFGTFGQPQTQQSPYSQQQSANLMQNTAQVGQNAYGSFVGQQKPQQQAMQQQGPQQQQNSVAPPMQAGFNFFNQGQDQGNTGGGGATGGGGLF